MPSETAPPAKPVAGVSRLQAVARGAVLGGLSCALGVSAAGAWLAVIDKATDLFPAAVLVGSHPLVPLLHIAVGTAVGAATGAVARKLRGGARRRMGILLLLSPVGVWVAGILEVAPFVLHEKPASVSDGLFALTSLSLYMALFAVLLAPFLGAPVIVGNLLLEGWTRPAEAPLTVLASPPVRRRVLLAMVATTAALGTFAVLRSWPDQKARLSAAACGAVLRRPA